MPIVQSVLGRLTTDDVYALKLCVKHRFQIPKGNESTDFTALARQEVLSYRKGYISNRWLSAESKANLYLQQIGYVWAVQLPTDVICVDWHGQLIDVDFFLHYDAVALQIKLEEFPEVDFAVEIAALDALSVLQNQDDLSLFVFEIDQTITAVLGGSWSRTATCTMSLLEVSSSAISISDLDHDLLDTNSYENDLLSPARDESAETNEPCDLQTGTVEISSQTETVQTTSQTGNSSPVDPLPSNGSPTTVTTVVPMVTIYASIDDLEISHARDSSVDIVVLPPELPAGNVDPRDVVSSVPNGVDLSPQVDIDLSPQVDIEPTVSGDIQSETIAKSASLRLATVTRDVPPDPNVRPPSVSLATDSGHIPLKTFPSQSNDIATDTNNVVNDPDTLPEINIQLAPLNNPIICPLEDDLDPFLIGNVATAEPEVFSKTLVKRELKQLFFRGSVCLLPNVVCNPVDPLPGEVYIFKVDCSVTYQKTIRSLTRADGYKWRNNGSSDRNGYHYMYHKALDDDILCGFTRTTYLHKSQPLALVHYKGILPTHVRELAKVRRQKLCCTQQDVLESNLPDEPASENPSTEELPLNYPRPDSTHPAPSLTASPQVEESLTATQTIPMNTNTPTINVAPAEATTLSRPPQFAERVHQVPIRENGNFLLAAPCTDLDDVRKKLSVDVVTSLLNDTPQESFQDVSQHIITNPKHGELYLFYVPVDMKIHWEKHILKDTYRWKFQRTASNNEATFVTKKYYIVTPPTTENGKTGLSCDFQKFVFYDNHSKRIVIHYLGDDEAKIRFPHGNSFSNRPHIATSDVVADKIRSSLHQRTREILLNARQTMLGGLGGKIVGPRDKNQIRYQKNLARSQYLLQGTEAENARHIAEVIGPSFVKQITIIPNVSVTLMSNRHIEEVKRMIEATRDCVEPLIFHYDTTFNCGKYYISMLTMRHILLEHTNPSRNTVNRQPNLVVAYHIHQRRDMVTHTNFLREVSRLLSDATKGEFGAKRKVLVVDQEFKQVIWPNDQIVYCWNHLITNIQYRMKKLNLLPYYPAVVTDFYNLAKSSSLQSFEQKLNVCMNSNVFAWANQFFRDYFESHTAAILRRYSGRWILRETRIPFCDEGMTNNAAEGVNTALRGWLDTKKRFKDERVTLQLYEVMLAANKFSTHEIIKVTMAYYNQSPEYHLQPQYQKYLQPEERMPSFSIRSDDEIIAEVNRLLMRRVAQPIGAHDLECETVPMAEAEADKLESFKGLSLEAKEVYDSSTFDFIDTMRSFKLTTCGSEEFFVRLGQHSTCSCGNEMCAHILAVRVRAGVAEDFEVPTITASMRQIPAHRHPQHLPSKRPAGKNPKRADMFDPTLLGNRAELFTLRKTHQSKRVVAAASVAPKSPISNEVLPPTSTEAPSERQLPVGRFQRGISRSAELLSQESQPPSATKQNAAVLSNTVTSAAIFNTMALGLTERNAAERSLRVIENSLTHNFCALAVDSSRLFRADEGLTCLYCPSACRVVVIAENITKEIMVFAARAVQHQVNANNVIYVGSVRTSVPELYLEMIEEDADKFTVSWQEFSPVCYCREPTSLDDLNKCEICISCRRCGKKFHNACLSEEENEATFFRCVPCFSSGRGARNGAGLVKLTCTVDNILTAMLLHRECYPDFGQHMESFQYPKKGVSEKVKAIVTQTLYGDWARAQQQWNTLRLSLTTERIPGDTFSLEGNPEGCFFSAVREGGTFIRVLNCQACKSTAVSPENFSFQLEGHSPLEQEIASFQVERKTTHPCSQCSVQQVTESCLQQLGPQVPWFIHFEANTSPYNIREALRSPKELRIPGCGVYKLALITLARPGHFSSVVVSLGHFLYYDDLHDPCLRLLPDDIFGQSFVDVIVHSITYLFVEALA